VRLAFSRCYNWIKIGELVPAASTACLCQCRCSSLSPLKQQLRVKPEPDPERVEETKWMTEEQIEIESEKPSTRWTETGSGSLGRLYVEVLGCDKLPNLDAFPVVGEVLPAANALTGGKTDAFLCLVFQDGIVNTDVIMDSLSPRWMPWSQRAFIFRIMHPSSQLMVGAFDFDSELLGAKHDPIGRVSVDISNLRPNTVYTLYYNLYTSALTENRTSTGQIKLRLRIEFNNLREVTLASMEIPPPIYVNVATHGDFETARFTCEGKVGTAVQHHAQPRGLKTTVSHLNALYSPLPL
jgi:hypothetical protein